MVGYAVSLRNYKRLFSIVTAVAVITIVIVAVSIQASSRGIAKLDFIKPLANHIKPLLSEEVDFAGYAARLAAHDRSLELLRYCNRPSMRPFDDGANFLVSINGPEGTVARMKFGWADNPRYNPNLLPYPVGSKCPYIGFARQSPKNVATHHEIVYCDMDWGETPVIRRRILHGILLPERTSPAGLCKIHKFLEPIQGHSDPRVFFSPLGEPLMMHLTNVPVRYSNLTLPREDIQEIEKNWVLLYDENNEEYVHHHIMPRSVSKGVNGSIILPAGAQELPGCMKYTLKDFSNSKDEANDYHQATNSLRVTMCEFPCVPTIHNSVLVSLIHIKYKNFYELFYRRYAIIMNVTAPFEVIARTNNLMFAGLDEQTMLYTVSMVWDKSFNARLGGTNTGHPAIQANDAEYDYNSSSTEGRWQPQNKLADLYYHGWIDDTVMINIGVNDCDAPVLHVPMRDVLDCIVLCE
ncbi:hypothetical protein V1508DRAFT_404362 [Lipomyces doorenjongii]|uniref:uncharacterized protein n=1 Tax=Lipomyces doorenjongii TaxID=383834 RepID=UPI0034CEBDE9